MIFVAKSHFCLHPMNCNGNILIQYHGHVTKILRNKPNKNESCEIQQSVYFSHCIFLGLFVEFCNPSFYVMISLCKDAKYYKYLDNLTLTFLVYSRIYHLCLNENGVHYKSVLKFTKDVFV